MNKNFDNMDNIVNYYQNVFLSETEDQKKKIQSFGIWETPYGYFSV
jgi:hypothetical protein